MSVGAGAASVPRPPQNAHRPQNGTKSRPLASKPVNCSYSSLQPKVLVTGLHDLKAPMAKLRLRLLTSLPDSEVSIRNLELEYMNFVGLKWFTLFV